MTSEEFDLGLAVGLALAGLLYLALWWIAKRSSSSAAKRASPNAPVPAPEPAIDDRPPAIAYPGLVDSSPRSGSALSAPSNDPVPIEPADPSPVIEPGPAGPSLGPPRPSPSVGVVRLSQRVILHVYAQGNHPPGAVAPPSLSQGGIGEALGVTQGGLAAVLRRLEAAGVLTAERGHVRGRDRRLKIYRLTSRGLELARDLRARSPQGRSKAPSAEPLRDPSPPRR